MIGVPIIFSIIFKDHEYGKSHRNSEMDNITRSFERTSENLSYVINKANEYSKFLQDNKYTNEQINERMDITDTINIILESTKEKTNEFLLEYKIKKGNFSQYETTLKIMREKYLADAINNVNKSNPELIENNIEYIRETIREEMSNWLYSIFNNNSNLTTKKLDNGDYRIEAELTSLPNLNSPQTYVNAQGEEKTYYIANAKIATMTGKEVLTSVSVASKTLDNANNQGGFKIGNHYLATGRLVQREGSKPVILIQLSHLPFKIDLKETENIHNNQKISTSNSLEEKVVLLSESISKNKFILIIIKSISESAIEFFNEKVSETGITNDEILSIRINIYNYVREEINQLESILIKKNLYESDVSKIFNKSVQEIFRWLDMKLESKTE